MLSEQLNRELELSVQLRMEAIRQKVLLAFTFCATVETAVRFGQLSEAERLRNKLCATMDQLRVHIRNTKLPDTLRLELHEHLVRLEERISSIRREARGFTKSN